MDKIWLKSYPPAVPAEIDVGEFASVGSLLAQSVARWPERVAYVNMGATLSYRDLDTLSHRFAAYLQGELGLARGSRIALMMPNVLQYPIAMFGALRAGYVVVNCNPLYTPRELENQLLDSGAEAIVIVENFCHTLSAVIARTAVKHTVVTSLGEMLGSIKGRFVDFVVRRVKKLVPPWQLPDYRRFNEVLQLGAKHALRSVEVGPDDIAFLQYTGGTTGVAKGAILSHGNILANVSQAHVWIRSVLREGEETIITALPLYHIFSLTANCLIFLRIGATNVLITNPRDIAGFVRELRKWRFSVITGVNTLFAALLRHPDFPKLDFSALRVSLGGGMAVQKAVAERWRQVTGCPLIEAYGLTETSPAVCVNPIDLPAFNGSIGLPLPNTEISLRDEAGTEVAVGQPGELCVRGPQVMRGYWNSQAETALVMTEDGFLRTGDVAVIDDRGYVRIVDRKKDVIIVSGFNVYPNEIEDVVAMHPGVQEVAAVGVPDERCGEAVKIFVVKRDPALTADDLVTHCKKSLTAYKVPHLVEFRDDLPKSSVGKILRRALRDELAER